MAGRKRNTPKRDSKGRFTKNARKTSTAKKATSAKRSASKRKRSVQSAAPNAKAIPGVKRNPRKRVYLIEVTNGAGKATYYAGEGRMTYRKGSAANYRSKEMARKIGNEVAKESGKPVRIWQDFV